MHQVAGAAEAADEGVEDVGAHALRGLQLGDLDLELLLLLGGLLLGLSKLLLSLLQLVLQVGHLG